MKGVELSEKYFEKFGMPMLEKDFAFLLPTLSAGLVGQGSECLFFDATFQKITTSSRDSAFFKRHGLRKIRVRLNPRVQQTSRRVFRVFPSEIFARGRQSPRRFFVQRLLRKYYRQKFRAKNNFRLAENPAIRPTHRRIGQDVYK